jgi:hypothetical protein
MVLAKELAAHSIHVVIVVEKTTLLSDDAANSDNYAKSLARAVFDRLDPPSSTYNITRTIFLRALGFIYFIAFLCANRQTPGLLGSDGLLPAANFLQRVQMALGGSAVHSFWTLPGVFWWNCSDSFLMLCTYIGLALSVLIMAGATNAILMFAIWILYMSFVHIGQIFYGYGWETMLLEAGFLAMFLCPIRGYRPSAPGYPAPKVIMWFYRWMLFRVMFGAGMIKIRGDECWRNLTCLVYHYETQPLPNPISWYLHHQPLWFQQGGVLFNHFVELIIPWFYFAPKRLRHIAGGFTVLFQLILIISGNLSFLNWLTIVIAIPCFDDSIFSRRAQHAAPLQRSAKYVLTALTVVLLWLSVDPIQNMMSSGQVMNASFDQWHLMNTYGAFGTVGRVRNEIIIEGSNDGRDWKEYEFLAKPGDPKRRPPFIAPYQSRIDWQMWFAAMEDVRQNPWLIIFAYKLLQGDANAIGLIRSNPFPQKPPKYLRMELYEYHFTKDHSNGLWWDRKLVGEYLQPVTLEDFQTAKTPSRQD